MNLPRAYAQGIFSPCSVGRKIPPKRKILRFHPQAHAHGLSRRVINNIFFLLTADCLDLVTIYIVIDILV